MTLKHRNRYLLTTSTFLALGLLGAAPSYAQTSGASENATWNCTGSPCPWGATTANPALVWPASAAPVANRLGYTVDRAIYLPAQKANGTTIAINSGTVSLYAGAPGATSHSYLTTISAGGSYQVAGLGAADVLSVQSSANFTYTITLPTPPTNPPSGTASQQVTLNCTTSPCPWGSTDITQALVWPTAAQASSQRLGYTATAGIYLPANVGNGAKVSLQSGSASVYAGQPNATSHRLLTSFAAGGTYEVSGLAAGEVVSVQSGGLFTYSITLPNPQQPDPEPTGPVSQMVTWTCSSSPCPWGSSTANHALVWPAAAQPSSVRYGYTVSAGIYLPTTMANGAIIWVTEGTATLYAGRPDASHHPITTLGAGQYYEVHGLLAGEVLSVQSDSRFGYQISLPDPPPPVDPNDIQSVNAHWRCDIPECSGPDWGGAVINWPSWAAYSSNSRIGVNSRTVYSDSNQKLYPYMGSWANGCHVTAKSGTVLVIEWQRGSETWRETYLNPGQSHTITLTGDEDNAMIETYDDGPAFSVALSNCTPQPLP